MSDTEKRIKRTELQRELIAVQVRIDNVKLIADHTTNPDEVADNILLLRLFLLFKFYLDNQQNLPFIKERVRQLKTHAQLRSLAFTPGLEEEELKLACAERGISDFHGQLPWWHETYTMTKERIDARAAKTAPAITAPETETLPSTLNTWNDATIQRLFPRSESRRAFGRAMLETQKIDRKELCIWIDQHLKVDLPEEWTEGENRSYEVAYKTKSLKPRMDKAMDKVRDALKEEKLLVVN